MIVRNEETNLPGCLASVRDWVDEILVCDTGSDDGTMAVAESLGARVVSFTWCDDFAAARNFALSQATGAWVLSLDADERVSPATAPNLRELISRPRTAGRPRAFQVLLRHSLDPLDDSDRTEQYAAKLFTRHPLVRWVSPIHEHVAWMGSASALDQLEMVPTPGLVIEHTGHRRSGSDLQAKAERNMALLRKAMVSYPSDPYYPFKLAQHHLERAEWAEAERLAATALELNSFSRQPLPEWLPQAYVTVAGALLGRGDLAGAGKACETGLSQFPSYAGLLYQLGTVHLLQRDMEVAMGCYEKALQAGPMTDPVSPDPGMVTWRPLHGLGVISEIQGDSQAALAYYERARAFAPYNPDVNLALARTMLAVGRSSSAETLLGKFLEAREAAGLAGVIDDEALAQLAGAIAQQGGRTQEAINRLQSAVAAHPSWFHSQMKLGQLLCDAGQYAAVLRILSSALDSSDAPPELYDCLARALTGLGRQDDARAALSIAAAKRA